MSQIPRTRAIPTDPSYSALLYDLSIFVSIFALASNVWVYLVMFHIYGIIEGRKKGYILFLIQTA